VSVEIVAGAIQLRPFHVDEADELLPALDDPDIRRWNRFGPRTDESPADLRRWIEAGSADGGSVLRWAVRAAVGGDLLGQVSLLHIDWDQADAEVGYWMLPNARGRGVGTTAVLAVTRYAFEAMGLLRLQLFHAVENTASCALATRAGFAYEGTHRRSHRYGDGIWHDEHSHARLASDDAS
jgi:RimJ/RimL family protein N-acetyltransferase